MAKLNAAWHEKHPLQRNSTMAQRVRWHVAHARACGCRDIPRTIVTELRVRGIPMRDAPSMMYPVAGGPSMSDLRWMAQTLHRRHIVVAVSMTAWDLGRDADGQTERSCLAVLDALVGG